MRIVSAKVRDFRRIELIEVGTDRDVVEVTGGNGSGKTSLLDAVVAGLGGRSYAGQQEIRRGATGAEVILELSEGMTVERRWDESGTTKLVVRTPEGELRRGQERLDQLLPGLSFDPMRFRSLTAKEQRDSLLEAVGVDFFELNEERREVYDQRTDANREVKRLEARLSGLTKPRSDTPAEEIDVDAIANDIGKMELMFFENKRVRQDLTATIDAFNNKKSELSSTEREIERLEQRLKSMRDLRDSQVATLNEMNKLIVKLQKTVKKLIDPDLDTSRKFLTEARATNQKVASAREYREVSARLASMREEAETLSRKLADIDLRKREELARAKMPIDGVQVDDDSLLFNGIPLHHCSTAEQVRVCTAIVAAMNPTLKIALVRNGNDLDRRTLDVFYEECRERGLQAWVERIEPSEPSTAIEIIEGSLA